MLPRLDGGTAEEGDGLQALAIVLVQHLGSHSISVAQLKKMFRLMQPLPGAPSREGGGAATGGAGMSRQRRFSTSAKSAVPTASSSLPLQPPWLCGLLRALRGMMGDQPGPQRFFLLDGHASGLRLPRMPRWPAQKGYTFCAWVRLEAAVSPSPVTNTAGDGRKKATAVAAGAPCLFSFCADRGQGVAACFVPLRKARRRDVATPTGAGAGVPSAEAAVQQYALQLRVGTGRKRPPAIVRFPGAVVNAGAWVFVAVAHVPSSWGQRSQAAVLVDSCWRSVPSPFPRFGDSSVTAAVACHCPPRGHKAKESTPETEGAGARIAGRPLLCSLRGQVFFCGGNGMYNLTK